MKTKTNWRVIGFCASWILYGAAVYALVNFCNLRQAALGMLILSALTMLIALAAFFKK